MKHDLIVFGEDWGRHPSSTQHLISCMGDGREVIWVNSIGMRRPKLNWRDFKRAMAKVSTMVLGAKQAKPNSPARQNGEEFRPSFLHVVAPKAVPWPGNPLANWLNGVLLSRQLSREMRKRRMKKPILWTSLPTAEVAVGRLGECAVVYYCGDDFGALAGVDHLPVMRMEQELVEKADLVIAASDELAQRFPAKKTLHIAHGVDFALFSTPQPRPNDLPAGPIAGFYGSIADWVDVERVARAAQDLPDWSFVFIGNIETDISALEGLENVHFLGPKPHKRLPAYAQHFDVAMLPFRDNEQIQACNPLKLREYMATGQPIVSTDFPALAPYRKLVNCIGARDNLADAILTARNDTDRNTLRQNFVKQESWEERARRIEAILETL